MFTFSEKQTALQQVAKHYACKIDCSELIQLFDTKLECSDAEQALTLCTSFQTLIDVAMDDPDKSQVFEPGQNFEALLFQLFNLFYNYMLKQGFESQWQQASDQAVSQNNQQ
ncbi:hypothetical protein [Psychrobium sp. 1_MG-2023]|uniref:hypothetical protein n=1 Tax=Psychrobium sp. 1_MG-2023 TaxID=3062624 RepID=UPI0027371211|nr:hypothetical protein [Psychrobium sp. 1_MG-2023]MDP2560587.1 hypothetical protein [Psychrobium sp. 1_MG-2023]